MNYFGAPGKLSVGPVLRTQNKKITFSKILLMPKKNVALGLFGCSRLSLITLICTLSFS